LEVELIETTASSIRLFRDCAKINAMESATIICASIPSAICGRGSGPIEIFDYNPKWPERFEVEASNIRSALGGSALQVEHVGSGAILCGPVARTTSI